jgi:putative peptide zinc metalloprotease protein
MYNEERGQMEYMGFTGFDEEIASYARIPDRPYVIFSRNGVPLKVSTSAYILLHSQAHGWSLKRLADDLNCVREGSPVCANDLQTAMEHLGAKLEPFENKRARRLPWGFWLRFTLLSARVVQTLSGRLTFFFSPRSLFGAALLLFVSLLVLARSIHTLPPASPWEFWTAYFLFLLSTVFHELGHAAAASRFGVRPREIGVALYLIYLVFYTDVTASWRLEPKRRTVVDLGGPYFQAIAAAILTVLFWATGFRAFLLAVFMIGLSLAMSVNPVFKFDGYWMLADMLNVERLDRVPVLVFRNMWERMRGKSATPLPYSGVRLVVLILYSFVAAGVWIAFVYGVLPGSIRTAETMITDSRRVIMQITAGERLEWASIASWALSLLILVSAARILYSLILSMVKLLRRGFENHSSRLAREQVKVEHHSNPNIQPEAQSNAVAD